MISRGKPFTPVLVVLTGAGLTLLVLLFLVSGRVGAQEEPETTDSNGITDIATDQKEPSAEIQRVRGKIATLVDDGQTDAIPALLEEAGLEALLSSDVLSDQLHRPITFWEDIESCGFYPQETRLECVIKIKRNAGYGNRVGTHESVLFCVDWNHNGRFDTVGGILGRASIEATGVGQVHVMNASPVGWPNHDGAAAAARPPWHYAVYRDIDPPAGMVRGDLRTTPGVSGIGTYTHRPTLKARAILSWLVEPTNCHYRPVWGDVFNFQIRTDPIR